MTELPKEARELLAAAPAEFVEERKRLARRLRDEGRAEEARSVDALHKPPPSVLAVNTAARSRPEAAESAYEAAERLAKAQLRSDLGAFETAADDLQQALDLLAEVAITYVARPGTSPSEALRRRVRDLLRGAVANEDSRRALRDGVLIAEIDAPGFDAFAGMTFVPKKAGGPTPTGRRSDEAARNRERARKLRDELARALERLREAEGSVREAEATQVRAESDVASIRAELERL